MSKKSESPKLNKVKNASIFIITLVLIPLTILSGVLLMNDRRYYFISLLVIILSMIPVFLRFEKRKPDARELIILASLTAVAVAGRAAFFMVPQFKPVLAIIIIAGVSFGGEIGFLVGAMTALVSNFFFGMGPFTPWQMFASGLIGLLAGYLFKKGIISNKRKTLCIFGGLSSFFIYGIIMDFSSVMLWTQEITRGLVISIFAAGLPFNIMHSLSTVVFLFLLARPMIDKLNRIKTKYGILDEL